MPILTKNIDKFCQTFSIFYDDIAIIYSTKNSHDILYLKKYLQN